MERDALNKHLNKAAADFAKSVERLEDPGIKDEDEVLIPYDPTEEVESMQDIESEDGSAWWVQFLGTLGYTAAIAAPIIQLLIWLKKQYGWTPRELYNWFMKYFRGKNPDGSDNQFKFPEGCIEKLTELAKKFSSGLANSISISDLLNLLYNYDFSELVECMGNPAYAAAVRALLIEFIRQALVSKGIIIRPGMVEEFVDRLIDWIKNGSNGQRPKLPKDLNTNPGESAPSEGEECEPSEDKIKEKLEQTINKPWYVTAAQFAVAIAIIAALIAALLRGGGGMGGGIVSQSPILARLYQLLAWLGLSEQEYQQLLQDIENSQTQYCIERGLPLPV